MSPVLRSTELKMKCLGRFRSQSELEVTSKPAAINLIRSVFSNASLISLSS